MEYVHDGLVYLTYTIFLLLAIVGFFTENEMPQIAAIALANNLSGAVTSFSVVPQGAVPGKTAFWSTESFPEIGRNRLEYAFRKADPSTGLVRHTFKATLPTLKSVVTDPSGPYTPPPVIDYPSAAELNIFVHPRATEAERDAVVAVFLRSLSVDTTLIDAIKAVVRGQSIY